MKKMRFTLSSTTEDILKRVPVLPSKKYKNYEIFLPSVLGGSVMGPKCTLNCHWGELKAQDTIIIRKRKSTNLTISKKAAIRQNTSIVKKNNRKSWLIHKKKKDKQKPKL